jgi:thiosulfate reductase cytochrome b subunit
MKTQKNTNVVMFTLMERLWHWIQAFSMVMLAISGISLHWPGSIIGNMKSASGMHHLFGYIVAINFVVWVVYMIVTGRIHLYLPKKEDEYPMGIFKQAKFYILDIYFTNKHPYHVGPKNRMNPMQKVAYNGVMFLAMPAQIITGFLLMFGSASVHTALIIHLLVGGFFVLFIVGHMYLATTGHTPLALFKEMIHGYEEDLIKEENK